MGRRFVDMNTILRRMQDKDDRAARDLRRRFPHLLEPEIVPFVEIVIVPVLGPVTPVVNVELVPAPVSAVEATIEDAQRAGRVADRERGE